MTDLRTTTAIAEAISSRNLLAFDYHGKARVVEPHTFGLDRWNRTLLCAFQVECDGAERPGWRFFFVEQMSLTRLDARRFTIPRPEYRRGDGAFKSITAEL